MTNRKRLVQKLDAVFSKYIRARDKRCVVCGTDQRLQCGHLFSRVAYSTRWSEINCNAQCQPCNSRHEWDSYPLTTWFLGKYGEEAYHELHREYATPRKYKDWELEELAQEYQAKLLNLLKTTLTV